MSGVTGRNQEGFDNDLHSAYADNNDLYNQDIVFNELLNALKSVGNTAPGNDAITYELLKVLKFETKLELLDIFNQAFRTGYFLDSWKKGIVFPILKPNKPSENVSSYRPITLLPCLGKIFERIIKNRLEDFHMLTLLS